MPANNERIYIMNKAMKIKLGDIFVNQNNVCMKLSR